MFGSICAARRLSTSLLFATTLALALLVGIFTGGCQPVGPTYRQDSLTTEGRPRAPNRLGLAQRNAEKDWNYQVESTASSSYTEITGDGSVVRAAPGAPTRDLYVTMPDGRKVTLASGSDVQMKGVSYEQDGANRSIVRIDEFATITSEPQRAVNESLDRLVLAWNALTEAEKQAHIEAWQTAAKLGDTLAPVLLTVFQAAAGG